MSCLLPQFKCLPDFLSLHSKTHLPFTTKLSTSRGRIYFRTKCSISTVSPPTSTATPTVLDMEKLRLMSLEAYSNPAAADIPWTHMGAISLPTEVNFGATLVKEALVTSEEATIAAASAEAIALAKAAVQVAKDAAMMVGQYRSSKLDGEPAIMPSGADTLLVGMAHLGEIGLVGVAVHSTAAEYGLRENFPLLYPIKEADDLKPTHEELDLLQTQRSDSIAVKSRRQSERKSRRAKAADKAAATVVSVKSSPTSRKKRASSQEVDYSDPLHYLRGTTSTYKLLTLKEEQELSGAIQDLLKLEKLQEVLAERCGEEPTFAQWAAAAGVDQKTLRKRLNYGIQCKDKMVKSNIRLVVSIAKKYQGAGMDLQDLVQEGCRGLVRSVEKFDASRGFKFSTYAHWWIKQAVRKSLSEQSRTIRLPFHMVDSTYKVKEARKRFFNENGRQPTNEEICKATGLSMKRLQAVLEVPKDPQSFDQETGMYQNYRLSEVIPDPDAESLEELVTKGFMKEDLAKVLDTLNPREKLVIKSRFGLEDGRMKTLQEIGDRMGVSRERIRQIESCAFRKLKSKRRSKHLQQYANS